MDNCTLYIDTSLHTVGVALHVDKQRVTRVIADRKSSARLVTALCEEVVVAAGVTVANIDAVVVSVGPGSFTGIRIGLAWAMGFARAGNVQLRGVSALEAAFAQYVRERGLSATSWGFLYPNTRTHSFLVCSAVTGDVPCTELVVNGEVDFATKQQWLVLAGHPMSNGVASIEVSAEELQYLALAGMEHAKVYSHQNLEPRYLRLSAAEEQQKSRATP